MMTVLEKANQKRDAAERGMGYGLPGYDWSYLQWWTAYIEGAEDQKREDAAAIEALQAEVNEQKQIAAHYEQSAKDWWGEACEYKAQLPHWVSVEEPPKRNDTVLVRDNGYRVLTYFGDGRWEDDYGYGAEFVSDDAEWCYIEPPQEVQE